jgi:hypothetical protein
METGCFSRSSRFFVFHPHLPPHEILFADGRPAAERCRPSPNRSLRPRGGSQGQTTIPPVNPALNQSTIQGPPDMQRTPTNRDAQMSRPLNNTGSAIIPAGTPELSPTAVPDVREQPILRDSRPRQSTDVVPSRSRRSNSSNVPRP